jgi:hypothetical protein
VSGDFSRNPAVALIFTGIQVPRIAISCWRRTLTRRQPCLFITRLCRESTSPASQTSTASATTDWCGPTAIILTFASCGGNPNVLYPGDRVFIPDQKPGERQCATDKRHTFEVKTVPLKLRVKLERVLSDPFANAQCELQIGADVFHLTTDGDGQIAQKIPTGAHTGSISIEDKIEGRQFRCESSHRFASATSTR